MSSDDARRLHDEAFEMIPWLVTGRLSRAEQERFEQHLAHCADCRSELAEQERLRNAVRRETSNIEHAPHASLQKLLARIDAEATTDTTKDAVVDRTPRHRWMLAAAAVVTIGFGVLLALSVRSPDADRAAAYQTVTSPPPQPLRAGQIRAVFAPNVTVAELTGIVSENRLTIVDGPSDSGVYTLAVQPGVETSVEGAISHLRSDPRVRFAEPVVGATQGPS